MSNDIETLRNICNQVMDDEPRKQAITALERLVAERDSLRKALDDRYAADQRAAKAIFTATGRTSGFPSVKEVVGFYMAEVERLRARLFPEDSPPADQERDFLAEQCATLGRENDSLRAKLNRAKEALDLYRESVRIDPTMEGPRFMGADSSALRRAWEHDRAVLSELSADAPAQQTQISDDMREAMAEAEKALVSIANYTTVAEEYIIIGHVKNIAHVALAKLRSVQ